MHIEEIKLNCCSTKRKGTGGGTLYNTYLGDPSRWLLVSASSWPRSCSRLHGLRRHGRLLEKTNQTRRRSGGAVAPKPKPWLMFFFLKAECTAQPCFQVSRVSQHINRHKSYSYQVSEKSRPGANSKSKHAWAGYGYMHNARCQLCAGWAVIS